SQAHLQQGRITPEYRNLMAYLEDRARHLYREGLKGLHHLRVGRAAVALAALQYQAILDKLRRSGYDNLSQRAHLKPWERLGLLPQALRLSRSGIPATEA
ncbi:MAG: squalene/phytoene synthase family protein, partial [Thermus sp.]